MLQNFLQDNNLKMEKFMKSNIVLHLQELKKTFLKFFSEAKINGNWVCNPFSCPTAPVTGKTMVEFIKLSSNGNLKLHFTNQPPSKF